MKNPIVSFLVAALFLAACSSVEKTTEEPEPSTQLSYPDSERIQFSDNYHGTEVADPYRWLEQLQSDAVRGWVREQNELSLPYLQNLNERDQIKNRLTQLWNYERIETPFRKGDRYFHFRNDGLQNQPVLYVSQQPDGVARPLLNPNEWGQDGTVSLARIQVSPNARYVAYAVSDAGSDWTEFRVRDVNTGQDLDDIIRGTKFTNVSWLPSENGFYYSRYPETAAGEPDDSQPVAIYFHRLGTSQSNDRRVYDVSQYGTWNPYPTVSSDGRFLIATVTDGFSTNAIHYLDLTDTDARWRHLISDWDARYQLIDTDANLLFFHTTNDAPTGRVIAVDINRPHPSDWQEIIAPREETLLEVNYVGGKFFAHYLQDAQSQVRIYNAYGRYEQELRLPGIGSISGFTGDKNHLETFFSFVSFTEPGIVYHYDIANHELNEHYRTEIPASLTGYETRQVFFKSADGTRIPMFIVHRDDIDLDGSNPTLLYGYGGFNISLTPDFSVSQLAWLEQGGILAIPNVRGGGEYGDEWHQGGIRLNKQNAFDDFIAAASYLIDQQYTSSEHLAIQGVSNGGLLVAAAMTQRPDLFAAALPAVGLFDMLRYHTTDANARSWSSDFGSSRNEEEFRALQAYSPLHNLEPGTCYPATLISTGHQDDRVAPWHSYKFAAALQHAQGCENPVLLRVETRAGHGAGTPTWMRIERIADQWAFLREHLNLKPLQNETD
ncbi:S9 family peptidase [Aliidiomarina minuta]|uniref:prolyl oligopeptidase n=1 Tax=Aliidiomarina minuta TaxID=880057 RepID=A0A432W124_9GAMM|nr:prolyl oligopeptidase family serine peptidase [Aliidiomarina minuta]RUO22924.1 S9 family peptidase [Aliidiomarina minuta]